jgi:hypothetical protein
MTLIRFNVNSEIMEVKCVPEYFPNRSIILTGENHACSLEYDIEGNFIKGVYIDDFNDHSITFIRPPTCAHKHLSFIKSKTFKVLDYYEITKKCIDNGDKIDIDTGGIGSFKTGKTAKIVHSKPYEVNSSFKRKKIVPNINDKSIINNAIDKIKLAIDEYNSLAIYFDYPELDNFNFSE